MKKNILFMIDSLHCGGAQKSLVSLLPLLNHEKYDITLLLLTSGGVFENQVPQWIKVVNYDDCHLLHGINKAIARYSFSLALRLQRGRRIAHEIRWSSQGKWISTYPEQFDAAIAYGQGFCTYFVAEKVNAKKKFAWINADLTQDKTDLNYAKQFYDKFDGIVTVSLPLEAKIKGVYTDLSNRIHTIYDVVNPMLIQSMAEQNFPDNHSIGESNTLRLTTVGRISDEKGYDLLVDAAAVLKDKHIDFLWKIVGDGYKNDLQQLIDERGLTDNIQLLGLKENPYPYMRACDIYVQTSRLEGFGLTVAEAKILHKPIVSTCFDTVYNQITPNVNGLVADMNGASIAENIIKLRSDIELCNKLKAQLEQEQNTTYITEAAKVEGLIDN